jgi:hypothetical protein
MDPGLKKKESVTAEVPPHFLSNIAGVVGEPKPASAAVL